MILAQVPFHCPNCERPYHIKVDLLKLRRLNRVAVCGRCKHQFSISVGLHTVHDSAIPPSSQPTPVTDVRRRMPTANAGSGPPPSSDPGLPPPDSVERFSEWLIDDNDDNEPPPPSSRPSRPRAAPSSDPGWDAPPEPLPERPSSWPRSGHRPTHRSEPKLPISRPRLGWSRRRQSDPEIPIPLEGDPVRQPHPSWPELDVELPPRSRPRPALEQGRQRREIVVEVGERGGKRGQRRTYRPETLIDDDDADADAG